MKKLTFKLKNIFWLSGVVILFAMISCRKYNSLGFTPAVGLPTISSVHTWNKTDTTTYYDTTVAYNSSGNLVQTINARSGRLVPFDSATNAGNLGNYYIINGTNLGTTSTITFNGLSAYFNRGLITDNTLVVQVPTKTPYYGSKANDSLYVTTLYGTVGYKFHIIAPPPTVSSYSNYNFSSGSTITLTGVGFASVTSITITGSTGGTGTTSIVSQNDSVMTIKFGTMAITRGILTFNYNSGGTAPGIVNDTQELVDLDNAYQVFTEGYAPSWGSWSWGPASTSTTVAKSGTVSFAAQYGANSWWIDGFRSGGGGATDGLVYSSAYKYLSFWVYGGTADEKIYIELGNNGFNQNQTSANQYNVPHGVWTYYKIPITSIMWNNTGTTNWATNSSQTLNTVAFFMNSNSVVEQLYFDDVILVK